MTMGRPVEACRFVCRLSRLCQFSKRRHSAYCAAAASGDTASAVLVFSRMGNVLFVKSHHRAFFPRPPSCSTIACGQIRRIRRAVSAELRNRGRYQTQHASRILFHQMPGKVQATVSSNKISCNIRRHVSYLWIVTSSLEIQWAIRYSHTHLRKGNLCTQFHRRYLIFYFPSL